MHYRVLLSGDAARDIDEIYRYIAEHDTLGKTERVLAGIEVVCRGLATFPERGNVPKELRSIGITEYRELHFKPYRAIYRVAGRSVIVYCVLEGRRDMQSPLQQRLLR